jgi:hypothetical protein
MVNFCKSLSKTLIITVALATFLSTAMQSQSVQAVPSKINKGKSDIVIKKSPLSKDQKPTPSKPSDGKGDVVVKETTLSKDQKSTPSKPGNGKGDVVVKKTTLSEDQKAAEVNALINALPKIDKLTLADATSVNQAYAAFTALSKAQKALLTPSNSGKITAAINKIGSLKADTSKALSELNSGKKAFSNFVKAGVKGAVEGNNTLYFAEITKVKLAKGSALTLAEIQVIVDTVNKSTSATTGLAVINSGTEVFADFGTTGITGAIEGNKAAYDTEITKAKLAKGSALTLAEIQVIVDTVNKSTSATTGLAVINSGTEVFADFGVAGITGSIEGNKAAYDTEIAKAKLAKGSALTLAEIQVIVDTINKASVDLQAAQIVINQIVSLDTTKETYIADVAAAKVAYETLTDAQKALVTNYDLLVKAV